MTLRTGVVMVALLLTCGCMSVHRGDFSLCAVGQDVSGTVSYCRVIGGNTNECFAFTGTKNASESTHTAANLIGAVVGACVGTAVAPGAGTAKGLTIGAAAGGALTEVWQTVKGWAGKKFGKKEGAK